MSCSLGWLGALGPGHVPFYIYIYGIFVTVRGIKTRDTLLRYLFTWNPVSGWFPGDHELARPFYGGITYIYGNNRIINLQVINIINFPLCITSSRTYSFNPGLYRPQSDNGPLPDRSATIRSRASPGLFGHYIWCRASPGQSECSPKPGCSRTIRLYTIFKQLHGSQNMEQTTL